MKLRLLGYLALSATAAALTAVACKEDPTASLANKPGSVRLDFHYMEVDISDSARTFATAYDQTGAALPTAIKVTSCDPTVASVPSTASDDPLPRTAFYVRGNKFGTTCVVAAASGLADTLQVSTFPTIITVAGRDTVVSGTTQSYTFKYVDAAGNDVTAEGIPAPKWRTDAASLGTVTTAGVLSGFNPGVVTVSGTYFRGPGKDSIVATKPVFVDPTPFNGTLKGPSSTPADSGAPTDTVFFVRAPAATRFNTDTATLRTFFDFLGIRTFVARVTTDSLYVIVPPTARQDTSTVVIVRTDANKVSEKATFIVGPTLTDHNDPASDDPATAPAITTDGDYYITLSGKCTGGSVTNPGDDCDDFFTIANSLARPDTITVNLSWFTVQSDLDILWCNAACTASVGNFDGATSKNPEVSKVIIPAATTWHLEINFFSPGGAPAVLARVRVSGKG